MENLDYVLGEINGHLKSIDERLEKIEKHSLKRDDWQEEATKQIHETAVILDNVAKNGCQREHSLKGVYVYATILFAALGILLTFFALKTNSEPSKVGDNHASYGDRDTTGN